MNYDTKFRRRRRRLGVDVVTRILCTRGCCGERRWRWHFFEYWFEPDGRFVVFERAPKRPSRFRLAADAHSLDEYGETGIGRGPKRLLSLSNRLRYKTLFESTPRRTNSEARGRLTRSPSSKKHTPHKIDTTRHYSWFTARFGVELVRVQYVHRGKRQRRTRETFHVSRNSELDFIQDFSSTPKESMRFRVG